MYARWAHTVELSDSVNGQTALACKYEGRNFNSGNYLFTTDTK